MSDTDLNVEAGTTEPQPVDEAGQLIPTPEPTATPEVTPEPVAPVAPFVPLAPVSPTAPVAPFVPVTPETVDPEIAVEPTEPEPEEFTNPGLAMGAPAYSPPEGFEHTAFNPENVQHIS